MDNPKVTNLWDFPIRTDRTIQTNRLDIVFKLKQSKTCKLTDMSVPSDSIISAKEFEKLRKYKDLEIQIVKMWKTKTKTISHCVKYRPKLCGNCAFPQNFHTRRSGEITIFYAVPVIVGVLRDHRNMLMKYQEICLLLKFKK